MTVGSVLVVDDDVDITSSVRDILLEFGYQADMANDGNSALELVRQNAYDVALLDFQMPDMDGVALYELIRKIQPSLVAIVVTAYSNNESVRRAKDAGTWQVLRKPVDPPTLMGLIKEVVSQPIVLVVDDDSDFCDSLWEILRDRGIRVSTAHTKAEAITRLSARRYDIVLLDMQLGSHDSLPVFQTLSKLTPAPETVLITGDGRNRCLADEMVEQGADCLCMKPLDMNVLLHKIQSLISTTEMP